MNKYCLFKGELVNAAPFRPAYKGSPHYVINVRGLQGEIFKYVVNAASDQVGQDETTTSTSTRTSPLAILSPPRSPRSHLASTPLSLEMLYLKTSE
jgi:hypothetical protein